MQSWSPASWRARPLAQAVPYADVNALSAVVARLRALPPLVTHWEVDRLRQQIAEAELGQRFVLQGGDCAESFADCTPHAISNKLKILLQMSLVLIHGGQRPVTRIGRLAGQYTKPRSSANERRGDLELPSYFGESVNEPSFSAAAREPNPERLLAAHQYAALTLNYVRSLAAGGFADLHHPEYWELSLGGRADLPAETKALYQRVTREVAAAIAFMEAASQAPIAEATRVEFFTSHEGLNLFYEESQTHESARGRHYVLSTHLPWIGERTRQLAGAHVEFFRGIQNPIGIKIGPSTSAPELLELCARLNPDNERGRLLLITRMGREPVAAALPQLVAAVRDAGRNALWMCDPMHGNTRSTSSGKKTRHFDDILSEIETTVAIHAAAGTRLGGIHFELTGDDVTECTGGGLDEEDLDKNYASLCDPRLNYRQALEMALHVARLLRR